MTEYRSEDRSEDRIEDRGEERRAAIAEAAARALGAAKAAGAMVATAESCTGGMVAAALTEIAGSSAVVDRGFVTYSNAAKTEMLGVDPALIAAHGAVSEPVARAMAAGALARSGARVAVAITGVAGPGGGSPGKPVGLVWFAAAGPRGVTALERRFPEDAGRAAIRAFAAIQALEMIVEAL